MQRLARTTITPNAKIVLDFVELFQRYQPLMVPHLPPSTLTLFATPMIQGDIVEWYSPLQGQPEKLDKPNDVIQQKIDERLNGIARLLRHLKTIGKITADQLNEIQTLLDKLKVIKYDIYQVNQEPVLVGELSKPTQSFQHTPLADHPVTAVSSSSDAKSIMVKGTKRPIKKSPQKTSRSVWAWLIPTKGNIFHRCKCCLPLILLLGLGTWWYGFSEHNIFDAARKELETDADGQGIWRVLDISFKLNKQERLDALSKKSRDVFDLSIFPIDTQQVQQYGEDDFYFVNQTYSSYVTFHFGSGSGANYALKYESVGNNYNQNSIYAKRADIIKKGEKATYHGKVLSWTPRGNSSLSINSHVTDLNGNVIEVKNYVMKLSGLNLHDYENLPKNRLIGEVRLQVNFATHEVSGEIISFNEEKMDSAILQPTQYQDGKDKLEFRGKVTRKDPITNQELDQGFFKGSFKGPNAEEFVGSGVYSDYQEVKTEDGKTEYKLKAAHAFVFGGTREENGWWDNFKRWWAE
ncbi:hypothetical protein [Lonepinella sp. BR2474]|uniref:hypothetical protein n=1 Tax=Lonepinella sp. BR2474 TaxID=3434548 RepID=UPI003F6DC536